MEDLVFRYVSYFFQRNCKFIQIFLDEWGKYPDKNDSVFGILIRFLDDGLSLQEIQDCYLEITNLSGFNIEILSYFASDFSRIQCIQDEINIEIVKMPFEFGTALKFDFICEENFVSTLQDFLICNYWNKQVFEFETSSQFRDLRPFSLSYSKPKIDFTESIISTISEIIEKKQEVLQILRENYDLDPKSLNEIMRQILLGKSL